MPLWCPQGDVFKKTRDGYAYYGLFKTEFKKEDFDKEVYLVIEKDISPYDVNYNFGIIKDEEKLERCLDEVQLFRGTFYTNNLSLKSYNVDVLKKYNNFISKIKDRVNKTYYRLGDKYEQIIFYKKGKLGDLLDEVYNLIS